MRRIAVIDERAPGDVIRSLEIRGYTVITLPSYSRLGEAVASHTDMLIFKVGKRLFSFADYCEERAYVFDDLYAMLREGGYSFTFLCDVPKSDYPHDAKINVLVMGKYVFLKSDTVSDSLLCYFEEHGYEAVKVKQGYPACTVLRLNECAAITADRGMAKAMSEKGIRVTLIEDGYFTLPPYEYGFIGGSAGVDKDTVYFTGNIESHPSYDKIIRAIEAEGMRAISLSKGVPADLGGILFC